MNHPAEVTALDVLLGTPGRPADGADLTTVLDRRGATRAALHGVSGIPGQLLRSVERQVNETVAGLLQVDVGSTLIEGWRRYALLSDAARRTRSGSREIVPLAQHTVTSNHNPWIGIETDGVTIRRIDLYLTITAVLHGVDAVVADAKLIAVGSGDCAVTVAFGVAPQGELMKRRREFAVGAILRIPRPVPLLADFRGVA
ncbi:hypothetical protein OG921_02080 [Aldersonia sp. NBC_00410]|uniref:hypothetical protein n=1 Tax=Aldersonia sp. NBC_00410 TaxID=2975954 RepID=UPI00225A88AD|nr:hypothetical protein [Aldersonia sp. NBC_00410]MCX5041983.1 hypothetical protein [Aldersonia sp. NBC_00410]